MTLQDFLSSDAATAPHLLLAGNPVSHSLSPLMHNAAAAHFGMDLRYHAVRVEREEFGRLLSHFRRDSFHGANVTLPHKESMAEAVDRLEEDALRIGALNTVVREGVRLVGRNTDVYGFLQPLQPLRDQLEGGLAVIFGTGGASRAVCHGLHRLGMERIVAVSRSPARRNPPADLPGLQLAGYDSWQAHAEKACLVVNTTPLGMHPETGKSPVRDTEAFLLKGKVVYDIVYRPRTTYLLRQAEEAGAQTIDGLEMFIQQGSRSFEWWTGRPFPIPLIREKLYEALRT
ncbi:MAG: shikimate dehydrogenase [Balneolaceae bacterium]|nr:shikimate dehydrogenase [Balneolaceae bacterium]